ncbi:MAG TPA: MarR family transcriptional regulator [Rhizobiales bacterium]|nr:MarR family transcriptional regulator [Hyphomicrobiales bacterium]
MTTDDNNSYKLDEQIGFALRKANQRHTAIFARLIDANLTPTQFAVLARLLERGMMTQNALGRSVAMDGATIKGVCDRLQRRGLVEAHRDEGDRRRIQLNLTAAGRELASGTIANAVRITSETLRPLTRSEQKELLRLLDKIS